MSRLPEPGDLHAAVEVWNARVTAVTGGIDGMPVGPVNTARGDGEGLAVLRVAVGDLYDPHEFLREIGRPLADECAVDLLRTHGDLASAVATAVIQAAAIGCLMERHRWEKR